MPKELDGEKLATLCANVEHIKEGVDWLRESDKKQWEQISELSKNGEGHDKTLGFLVKGFWMLIAGGGSLILWLIQSKP